MSTGRRTWGAKLPLTIGFAAMILLVGGLGAWSLGTRIAGAVVATGTVQVESDRQVIQHPDGGVVGEILARDGDTVAAGEVVVRLDDTFLRSELQIIERQLLEIYVRRMRLEAERGGLDTPEFAPTMEYQALDPDWIESQRAGQIDLFEARKESLAKAIEQLGEQRAQVEKQIEGIEAQRDALARQLELVQTELADLSGLLERGLVQVGRVLEFQREEASLIGEIGRLTAAEAEARGRVAGLEIEIVQLEDQRREDAISRLRDLRYNEIELEERRLALNERLARLEVRSPVAGTVFGSRVSAVQSVVQSADPMMYVVPGDQPLQISARIPPIHIDQVYPGQEVNLRFTTFDQRQTPVIQGSLMRVSADIVVDDATGEQFYEAIVLPNPDSLAAVPQITLMPGLPVEAFLKTRDRTPLSYLTQPLTNYLQRAFRED